jgi:PEP-CTERM motif
MCTLLIKKFFVFHVPSSLAEKKVLIKKLIASITIVLTVGLGAGGLTGSNAVAAPFIVLLESDANTGAGQEVFLVTYNSYADLISNNQASSAFSQLNISASYSAGGLAYDGSQFHVLLESDANTGAGQEVFLVTYNSYADLISNNQASSAFSQLNISASYSVGGFTYDGSQFHVLLESDANTGAGQEVFLVTYNSYADLISDNQASSAFSQLNISASYSAGGLTYDGSQFHVLLESDANTGAGQEVFLVSYDSYADLISNNQASSAFSQLNISASYSAGGITALNGGNTGNGGNGNVVSEPATMALILIGLSFLGIFVRRKNGVWFQAVHLR